MEGPALELPEGVALDALGLGSRIDRSRDAVGAERADLAQGAEQRLAVDRATRLLECLLEHPRLGPGEECVEVQRLAGIDPREPGLQQLELWDVDGLVFVEEERVLVPALEPLDLLRVTDIAGEGLVVGDRNDVDEAARAAGLVLV